MRKLENSTASGFAIAIAWPETYCKQSGNWYDSFLTKIGIAQHHYYKVGHAALVLVNAQNGECRYFDFGRYHTPWKHGRTRSELTDPSLKVNTVARISASKKEILNFEEILTELQLNPECHGEGSIHASYAAIDYENALAKAYWFQVNSPFSYGPFSIGGSNCSRFVNDTLVAGKPDFWSLIRLRLFVPLTPTPLNNVHAMGSKTVLPKLLPLQPFSPTPIADTHFLKTTLPQPARAKNIPPDAQWLSGEGCGSWFHIQPTEKNYQIARYNPQGVVEFVAQYIPKEHPFDPASEFKLAYLSHYERVIVHQNQQRIEFVRVG